MSHTAKTYALFFMVSVALVVWAVQRAASLRRAGIAQREAGKRALGAGRQQIREGQRLVRSSRLRYLLVIPLLYLSVRMLLLFIEQ